MARPRVPAYWRRLFGNRGTALCRLGPRPRATSAKIGFSFYCLSSHRVQSTQTIATPFTAGIYNFCSNTSTFWLANLFKKPFFSLHFPDLTAKASRAFRISRLPDHDSQSRSAQSRMANLQCLWPMNAVCSLGFKNVLRPTLSTGIGGAHLHRPGPNEFATTRTQG
jgi:hypothetical protein